MIMDIILFVIEKEFLKVLGKKKDGLGRHIYAVGAQCHVAGHIIVRWHIFHVRGINIFQELSQSH